MDHSKQRIDALVQESIIRYNQYMDMTRLLHNIIASIFHSSLVVPMVIEIEVTQKRCCQHVKVTKKALFAVDVI